MQFLFQSISHFHSFLLKRPSDLEYTQKAVYLSSNKTEYLSFDWDIVYLPTGGLFWGTFSTFVLKGESLNKNNKGKSKLLWILPLIDINPWFITILRFLFIFFFSFHTYTLHFAIEDNGLMAISPFPFLLNE